MTNRASYTAASTFPAKVVRKAGEFMNGELIRPHHPQISLTNRCNLSCEFCSCSEREKQLEMPLQQAKTILMKLCSLGAKALTITGGGEPLLHPHIEEIIEFAVDDLGLQVGLVTNGKLLHTISVMKKLTWCRVSFDGRRDITDLQDITLSARAAPMVDWAFSYVVTSGAADLNPMTACIEIANDLNFTHVRVVSDILDDRASDIVEHMREIMGAVCDDSKVIYQSRKEYTRGTKRCCISLLKPFIGTDGQVYPCCGIQYAKKGIVKGFPQEMQMGDDILGIYQRQEYFDGSACDRCYYAQYNEVLNLMSTTLDHEDFV